MEEKDLSISEFEKKSNQQQEECLTEEEIKSETNQNYDNLEKKFWRTLTADQNPSMVILF
jgi:thymidylate kinase